MPFISMPIIKGLLVIFSSDLLLNERVNLISIKTLQFFRFIYCNLNGFSNIYTLYNLICGAIL